MHKFKLKLGKPFELRKKSKLKQNGAPVESNKDCATGISRNNSLENFVSKHKCIVWKKACLFLLAFRKKKILLTLFFPRSCTSNISNSTMPKYVEL